MNIETCQPHDLGRDQIALWKSWQRSQGLTSPLFCPETWIAKSHHLSSISLAVVSDGGDITAFLPFQRRRCGVARVQFVASRPDMAWSITEIMRACNTSVFEYLDLVSGQTSMFRPTKAYLQQSPYVDLSPGWSSWLAAKKQQSTQFRTYLRKGRKTERELGKLHLDTASKSHDDLDQLIDWKTRQFTRTGHQNRFADPAYCAMLHSLLDADAQDGFNFFLTKLSAGGQAVALDMAMSFDTTVTSLQTTYDPDPHMRHYSFGITLLLQMLETLAGQQFTKVELGVGNAPYKELFKDGDDHVTLGWTERRSLAAVRYRMLEAPKHVLDHYLQTHPRLLAAARDLSHRRQQLSWR